MDACVINPLGSILMVSTSEPTATDPNANVGNILVGSQEDTFKVNDCILFEWKIKCVFHTLRYFVESGLLPRNYQNALQSYRNAQWKNAMHYSGWATDFSCFLENERESKSHISLTSIFFFIVKSCDFAY
jgi:hypothetical protein